MAVDDQSVNNKVLKSVVMTLNDKIFQPTQIVAMCAGKISLRANEIVVTIDSCRMDRSIGKKRHSVVVPIHG